MHYSWGKFYTPPPFSQLYDEYGTFANPSLPNVRDVNADPPEATAYEMGLQWGFHPDYLVDVTAYYRDIENYGRTGYAMNPDPAAGAGFGSYTFTTSFGYADARGIEVSLFRRPGKMVGTSELRLQLRWSATCREGTTPSPPASTAPTS